MIRSLWASVQGDPVLMRRVNGWLTIFWIALIPVAEFTGWVNGNGYISRLSEVALVLGSWSAWQAARVEVRQEEIHVESLTEGARDDSAATLESDAAGDGHDQGHDEGVAR